MQATFVRGKMEGVTRRWYADGRLAAAATFMNGLQSGLAQQWYEDGSRRLVGDFAEGRRKDDFFAWREDGSLDEDVSGTYLAGERRSALDAAGMARAAQLTADTSEVIR